MSLTTLPPPPVGLMPFGPPVKRWTTDEYHELIKHGLIPEGAPLELIDGMLVYKDRSEEGHAMPYGPRHAFSVNQLVELNSRLKQHGFHVRSQVPVTLAPNHEPEPDGAVVRGMPLDYRARNPVAADCCLVVEVADSSLYHDRGTKQRIYASAGIASYWIINLRNNTIEVYEQPDSAAGEYRVRRDRQSGETVELALPGGGTIAVRVDELIG